MPIKLIIALDFNNQNEALRLVDQLNPNSCALKIGSEMFTLFGPEFVRCLIKRKFKVFLDLKFHDIPTTVARACAAGADLGVWMLNVHAAGGLRMMQAAKESVEVYGADRPILIAVTVLTSMTVGDLQSIGIAGVLQDHVPCLAKLTQEAGLDGVVCSALEAPMIKKICGHDFIAVTPGIRLSHDESNDQVRVVTPQQALIAGSDYLVIGRPITRAVNPAKVVYDLCSQLE